MIKSHILSTFPAELLFRIINQINDPKTFKNLSSSCKLFRQLCSDQSIQNNAKERMKKKNHHLDLILIMIIMIIV